MHWLSVSRMTSSAGRHYEKWQFYWDVHKINSSGNYWFRSGGWRVVIIFAVTSMESLNYGTYSEEPERAKRKQTIFFSSFAFIERIRCPTHCQLSISSKLKKKKLQSSLFLRWKIRFCNPRSWSRRSHLGASALKLRLSCTLSEAVISFKWAGPVFFFTLAKLCCYHR